MIKQILSLSIIAIAVATGVLLREAYDTLYAPLPVEEDIHYSLAPGTSLHSMANELQALGLIKKPFYVVLYGRLLNISAKLQAGEYRIAANSRAVDLLEDMQAGKVLLHSFTIIEGWTFKQLLQALRQSDFIENTLPIEFEQQQYAELIGYSENHPEGLFYPDTYLFPAGSTDISVLKRAYAAMQTILAQEWEQRDAELPLKSPYEALILASIIERESSVHAERGIISAVFINRLRKRMRLQTDPTVIYGMGDAYDGDIRFRDLRRDTPYNTYTRHGLTPTPIAMPSQASIHAALHPEESKALYFVAKGDGSHQFSTNLADHEAAVDRYQRRK